MRNNNLHGGEKLPNSLSKDETIELFKEMNKGSIDARNKLIEHNLRLVVKIVTNHFYNTIYDIEDLISIGELGLIKAVDTFDITKNNKFSTYAARCINNEILMYLRNTKKINKNISIEETISTDKEGEVLSLKDILTDDTNIELDYENSAIYPIIRKIVEELPEREKEIAKLYFGFYDKVYSQREISRKCGISQSYVNRIINNKILPKIRNKLEILDIVEIKYFSEKEIYEMLNLNYEIKEKDNMINENNIIENLQKEYSKYNVPNEIYEDAINKSLDLKSYADVIINANKYIDNYLIENNKDNIDFEIMLIDNFNRIKVIILKKHKIDATNLNRIYEDAIEYILNNYDKTKTISKNILDRMLNIIKEEKSKEVKKDILNEREEISTTKKIVNQIDNKETTITKKIILQDGNKEIEKKMNNKSVGSQRTIYRTFKNNTESQVNEMLTMLVDDDMKLIKHRYGDNLNEVFNSALTTKEKAKFYQYLMPKMKRILKEIVEKENSEIEVLEDNNASYESKEVLENTSLKETKETEIKIETKENGYNISFINKYLMDNKIDIIDMSFETGITLEKLYEYRIGKTLISNKDLDKLLEYLEFSSFEELINKVPDKYFLAVQKTKEEYLDKVDIKTIEDSTNNAIDIEEEKEILVETKEETIKEQNQIKEDNIVLNRVNEMEFFPFINKSYFFEIIKESNPDDFEYLVMTLLCGQYEEKYYSFEELSEYFKISKTDITNIFIKYLEMYKEKIKKSLDEKILINNL